MNRFHRYALGSVLAVGFLGFTHAAFGGSEMETMTGDSHCKLRTLKGHYIYAHDGFIEGTHNRVPFAEAGHEVYHGDGKVTGWSTLSTNGDAERISYSGTYTVNPDCSGTTTLTDSDGNTSHYDMFITDDGGTMTFVQTDPGYTTAGWEVRRKSRD